MPTDVLYIVGGIQGGKEIKVAAKNVSRAGSYDVTVTVSLVDYSSDPTFNPSVEASFVVTIVNPCLTTSLFFGAIGEMIYKFGDPDLTKQLVAIDSASVDYGNKDGLTLCGAR